MADTGASIMPTSSGDCVKTEEELKNIVLSSSKACCAYALATRV